MQVLFALLDDWVRLSGPPCHAQPIELLLLPCHDDFGRATAEHFHK